MCVAMLGSSPERNERVLRATIATALAAVAVVPLATTTTGCLFGACGGGFQSQHYTVTFVPCAADAGDVAPDGGACPATCREACEALEPSGDPGAGDCADLDAGFVALTPGTSVTVECQTAMNCTGRRLDGIAAPFVEGEALGAWLARAAWLEASAVHAFRRLARELRAHGAPAELVRAARASARDEVRHARALSALAKKHGADVPNVEVRWVEARDLETIARENAVEGCVSESYGAAVAAWQASCSNDPEVARAMASIAPDELRHAALGWAVHAWTEQRLGVEARARVRRARDEAAEALLREARETPAEHALASAMASLLWAA